MLAETAAFVEAWGRRHGIAPADRLRLTLIVEELFSNTVVHGHGGDSDTEIGITLSCDAGNVSLLYEDAAPRFDPLAAHAASPHHLSPDLESRPVGGLGLLLVNELARDACYAFEDGRNRLRLTLSRSA